VTSLDLTVPEPGLALEKLREVQKGQREKKKPVPKPKVAKPKLLALPTPQLALPKPEDL
jgi:hypothetical protein